VSVVEQTTVRTAVIEATRALHVAGVPSPRHDAEELLGWLLDCPRSELWRHQDQPVPDRYDELVQTRASRVPLQHITGRAYFRHLVLAVGPGVFVPRPETEIVVEHALHEMRALQLADAVVVDLCSGSGAIALSIADEAPAMVSGHLEVHAVEADDDAIAWLRHNCADSAVVVHHADLAAPLGDLAGRVDLVVANPPYIPLEAVPRDLEVARHDPSMALYSGADGLDHIRAVERSAARLLRSGGAVVVEHSDEQGAAATRVFGASTWCDVLDHQDLTGRDRFVSARRAG
jgi:release factor glutamine methyltransferase